MKGLAICIFPLFLTIFQFTRETNSAKILSIAFFSSKSHKITYEPLLQELATRGHEVTVLAPVVFGHKKIREIKTFDAETFMEEAGMPNLFEMREKSGRVDPRVFQDILVKACNLTYDLPSTKAILKEKFDLVIIPSMFNECSHGYAYLFNAPIIIVSSAAAPSWVTSVLGTPTPPSFVANVFTSFTGKMTFYERGVNLFANAVVFGLQKFYFKPSMEALYRVKLNDSTLPSSDEILRERTSIILSSSHLSLGQARPFLPDIIEVGGMHCRPAQLLPKELEDFVNSSGSDGFILFSMGSALKGSTMSENQRKIFLSAFEKLKQKVLWKWETETMAELPPNVKLSKWLPQQDVLGHPKIKLFITHGGLGSSTEAVYHGVPLVGIPMFGDQDLNMAKAVVAGYAITLEFTELTEDLLVDTINKIVTDPSYKEKVQKLSKVFNDQPDKPLDRAVFWTEYVLRHKGAVHLRSPARDLNFFQYHSLDVILFLFVVTFVILYIAFVLLTFIVRKIWGFIFGSTRYSQTPISTSKKRN